MSIDAALLAIDRALGDGAVHRDRDVLAAHAGDESECPSVLPDAVVVASSTEEVAAVLSAAHAHRVAVTPRAAGTGKSGGCIPVAREGGNIVLSLEGFAGIEEIHPGDQVAVVRPGTRLGAFKDAVLNEDLYYPPDPNSLESCTLGGNLAENAGGPGTLRYGSTRDWVLGLEVVLADGSVQQLGKRSHKGVTGYDLTALMVGSEGTLGIITRATLKLIPRHESLSTILVMLGALGDVGPATTALHGVGNVRCIELFDDLTLGYLRADSPVAIPANVNAVLLVELEGSEAAIDRSLEEVGGRLMDVAPIEILVAKHAADRERLWSVRRAMSYTLRRSARFKRSEDVVVPRSRLSELLVACRRIAHEHGVRMPSYGHAGDGNLHVNFLWDDPDALPRVAAAQHALFVATVSLGGTLSGEHGIGLSKRDAMPLEQSEGVLALQRRIKDAFDPQGILNPGKILPARHSC
jgi:glycolate oxidase